MGATNCHSGMGNGEVDGSKVFTAVATESPSIEASFKEADVTALLPFREGEVLRGPKVEGETRTGGDDDEGREAVFPPRHGAVRVAVMQQRIIS